jgi:hypothetical protein
MANKVPCSVSWACTDCLMVLANGEYPPDQTEAERNEYKSRMERCIGDSEVTLGMLASEHADDCPNKKADTYNGHWDSVECSCETYSFSWSACDVCGSNLGGERHAVTYWVDDPMGTLTPYAS